MKRELEDAQQKGDVEKILEIRKLLRSKYELDAPDTRNIKLNFSTDSSKITKNAIIYALAGVGIVAIGIYLVKKYKLIK